MRSSKAEHRHRFCIKDGIVGEVMFYQKGYFMIMGPDIPNDEDEDRPLIKIAYMETISGGEKKFFSEIIYKDLLDGLRSGDYELYANPWNSRRVIITYQGQIISHRPGL